MTRKRRCEACGCFTEREQSNEIERVVCNECSRGTDTELAGTMDGVTSAKRDDGAEPIA